MAALALVWGAHAHAADGASLETGAEVRIWAPSISSAAFAGTFIHLEEGYVVLAPLGHSKGRRFGLDSIDRITVRHRRSRLGGALLGGLTGLAVGATIGAITCRDNVILSPGGCAIAFGVLFAPVGALIGAIVPGRVWKDVDVGRTRVTFQPIASGRALALSVSF
jgi:hypothetical protein